MDILFKIYTVRTDHWVGFRKREIRDWKHFESLDEAVAFVEEQNEVLRKTCANFTIENIIETTYIKSQFDVVKKESIAWEPKSHTELRERMKAAGYNPQW